MAQRKAKPTLLVHAKNGRIMTYTPQLAQRSDMIPAMNQQDAENIIRQRFSQEDEPDFENMRQFDLMIYLQKHFGIRTNRHNMNKRQMIDLIHQQRAKKV